MRKADQLYSERDLQKQDILYAAGLIARYAKKTDGKPVGGTVLISNAETREELFVEPLEDKIFAKWKI